MLEGLSDVAWSELEHAYGSAAAAIALAAVHGQDADASVADR